MKLNPGATPFKPRQQPAHGGTEEDSNTDSDSTSSDEEKRKKDKKRKRKKKTKKTKKNSAPPSSGQMPPIHQILPKGKTRRMMRMMNPRIMSPWLAMRKGKRMMSSQKWSA